ncbi:MAG: hypothetical protein J4O06_08875, partial [Chloroflexi bacterium]|nr:hypothetical protein [Chloroflexota bacterium]
LVAVIAYPPRLWLKSIDFCVVLAPTTGKNPAGFLGTTLSVALWAVNAWTGMSSVEYVARSDMND